MRSAQDEPRQAERGNGLAPEREEPQGNSMELICDGIGWQGPDTLGTGSDRQSNGAVQMGIEVLRNGREMQSIGEATG